MREKSPAQTSWDKATPAERAAWQKAMQAGARRKLREQRSGRTTDNARRAVEQHRLEATA